MKVENLAIKLRKRSYWEAIDLGFALSRQWFLRLWGAWLMAALPMFILTMTLIYFTDNETIQFLIFILFWWCKPLYEQPLLYILSRQLFSEPVTLRDIFKNYFQVIKPQLPALLLWRRFSLSRSFNNPVAMLEGLTKKERRTRLNVLHAQQSNASQWLTTVCLHLEFVLHLSVLVFIFALVPDELGNGLTFWELFSEKSTILFIITNITYFIAISIIAPMYVSAGFALYITRRVKLEGWDIELAFKRMRNRLDHQKHVSTQAKSNSSAFTVACIPLLASLIFACFSSSPGYADNTLLTIEKSKTTIEKVLQHDDFGKESTKKKWTYTGPDLDENDENTLNFREASIMLKIFEIIIWLAVAAFILWLVYKYSHWLTWIKIPSRTKKNNPSIPNIILGMEINKASLPDDVLATFSDLINAKQYREALGLLYRATLSAIIHSGDIEIPASATERECSDMVSRKRNHHESRFFKNLTQAWIMLAYADREPTMETLSSLRDEWTKHYLPQSIRKTA